MRGKNDHSVYLSFTEFVKLYHRLEIHNRMVSWDELFKLLLCCLVKVLHINSRIFIEIIINFLY